MTFWDTSALLRCYEGNEPLNERARNFLLDRKLRFASALLRIEAISGIRRRFSRNKAQGAGLLRLLEGHLRHFSLVPLDEGVLRAAEGLLDRHPLRAADALHLSSAILLARELDRRQFRFVTADGEQLSAAKAEGLRVISLA
ncbi:MAG: type II toxin-antitoxin system VapC family toxin [Planctomycetes bacterium]|nr:type II toxin-antitoxin system VapC family toxin [Planctomycetota bacterium]